MKSALFILPVISMVLYGCDGEKSKEHDFDNPDIEPIQITDVVSGYMALKDALVASDFKKARSAAIIYRSVVTGNVEASFEKALRSVADKLVDAENIGDQRKYFEQISGLMFALAENGAFDQTLYKLYCPMAFDNRGAFWLSLDEDIQNPYFGDQMLKCGYVEEIL